MSRRYLTAAVLGSIETALTERDWAVLKTVSDLRFVSGAQLARLHFAGTSARAARRALLRLTDLQVLERLPRTVGGVRAGSAGFVYRLSPAGQRLAATQSWQPRGRRHSHIPGTLFLKHALQVAELHTQLVEADRSGRIELLELTAEPACWRSWGQATLKPDSFVRLGIGDYEDSYFVEVDMGSEGSRAVEHKLRDYLAYAASGLEQAEHGVFPKVLWLAPDEQRVAIIEDCVMRLSHSAHELFTAAPFTDVLTVINNTTTTN